MPKKNTITFNVGDLIVTPAHGVGRIVSVGRQEIQGIEIDLVSILIEENGLTLRVPRDRAGSSGLRELSARPVAERALSLMRSRPRGKTGTWSRRAHEYEKKINSGDLLLAAEVVRDLRGRAGSYSERQIYDRALNRVAREIGPVLGQNPEKVKADIEKTSMSSAA